MDVRAGLQLRSRGRYDQNSESTTARYKRDRDGRLFRDPLGVVSPLAEILDEGRLFRCPGRTNRALLDRSRDAFHLLASAAGGDTGDGASIWRDDADCLSARWDDDVENCEDVVTRLRDSHLAKRHARDLSCGFGLLLLIALRIEESRVLDCDSRLAGDQHDEIQIVPVVRVDLVREDLHYSHGPVVVGEGRRNLALHFPLRRHLKDRSLPPTFRLRGNDRHARLENLGDRLSSIREVEDTLPLALLGIYDDAMRIELLAHGVGDHERKAWSVYHRRDRLVDLSVHFIQRDRGRDGLLHRRDRGKSRGATLELGDELSRQ